MEFQLSRWIKKLISRYTCCNALLIIKVISKTLKRKVSFVVLEHEIQFKSNYFLIQILFSARTGFSFRISFPPFKRRSFAYSLAFVYTHLYTHAHGRATSCCQFHKRNMSAERHHHALFVITSLSRYNTGCTNGGVRPSIHWVCNTYWVNVYFPR